VVGRTEDDAERLIKDAQAIEAAGAFAVVLEAIPAKLSKLITEKLKIPTIGIGAGIHCDGQIQVVNDILGLFTDFVPKHTKRYANLSEDIRKAMKSYVGEVVEKKFPDDEHSF
jgi:3-methyl-2-oxobutanoate hydroxymethyltransferase